MLCYYNIYKVFQSQYSLMILPINGYLLYVLQVKLMLFPSIRILFYIENMNSDRSYIHYYFGHVSFRYEQKHIK